MENGLNVLRTIKAGSPVDIYPDVSFGETVRSTLSYKYSPILDRFSEARSFPDQPENGYKAINNIPEGMEEYGSTLLRATNQEHMDYLVSTVKKSQDNRLKLANSGVVPQFAAELFDPINWMGIPFARVGTFAQSALRGGAATGAIVGMQEAVRYPFDPMATPSEAALNIGSAWAMGGLITGLATIPAQRRFAAQKDAEAELKKFQEAMAPVDGKAPDASIASSMFTDSWLYNAVTTPMKRVLQSKDIPNEVKLTTLKIANDSGVLLEMNRKGQKVGNSVYQNAKQFEGEWVALQDEIMPLWGESTGKGVVSALDYTLNRSGYESWLQAIDRKSIKGEAPADAIESQVMEKINNFYRTWETRLGEQGLIGSKASLERAIKTRETRIAGVQKRLEGKVSGEYRAKLEAQLRRYTDEIEVARANIEDLGDSAAILPPNESLFRPRYFDLEAITNNRQAFENILKAWFKENPQIVRMVGPKFTKKTLSTDDASIALRAKEATDNILGMKDVTDPEMGYYGAGKSKHFKHRALDIPNELVIDFIQTNPVAVMKAYTQRVGPRYEFARQFNGASIDDVLDDVMIQMMDAGKKPEQAYAVMKDMRHLYRRVTGGVLRDPDSWDQTTAKILKDLATLNYLGKAGVATLTEPAKIMMEHGVGTTMRALFGVLNDNKLKLAGREARLAGEAMDNIMNSAHLRLVDELNNNPFKSDIFDKMKNPFFLLNGLGPITKILKDFDAMVRSHTLIDYSVRWSQGKATKMEKEYLLRYNIDLDRAKAIANAPWQKSSDGLYYANTEAWTNTIEFPSTTADIISGPTGKTVNGRYSPAFYNEKTNTIRIDEEYVRDVMYEQRGWEDPRVEGVTPIKPGIINSPDDYVTFIKMHEVMHSLNRSENMKLPIEGRYDARKKDHKAAYENAINDLAVAEIEKQARVSPDTVRDFRSALSSGILNTILMGTPADKPIISDGIAYVPMRVARKFGMKEDPEFTGYARIENGFLGMPFQFYSYSLASVNKVAAAYAHGQLKSQFLGTAIAMGLGYMVLELKTPDFVDLSFQDKLARSFDYSGVAALYSDMMYTAMSTSLALGGPNLTNGFLEPRFPQKPNTLDALTGLGGAGASTAADIGRGVSDIVKGNVGKGTAELIDNAPMTGLFVVDGMFKAFGDMLEDTIDGKTTSGFKRY
jgi:hypothetical protein